MLAATASSVGDLQLLRTKVKEDIARDVSCSLGTSNRTTITIILRRNHRGFIKSVSEI